MRVPIVIRLAVGFSLAAALAATVTEVTGLQQTALLRAQANFYQDLLQDDTLLTKGTEFLKSIETLATTLSDPNAHLNEETLTMDEQQLASSIQQCDSILVPYTTHDLLTQHPEQIALLDSSNPQLIVEQQRTYAAGTLRAWYLYKGTQMTILQDVKAGKIEDAQNLFRLQSEPEFADTLSAVHSLLQFNTRLASWIDGATGSISVSLTTLCEATLAFLGVILVGFLISRTLVRRLKSLHRVTQAVKQGKMDTRVVVKGNDEIADVSHSINTMLDSLVAALQQATTAKEQTDLAYAQQLQLNEMKDHFIQHVSHELRTPLTQVYGSLQILQEDRYQLDAKQYSNFVDLGIKGCEELITMCTTILDTSKQAAMKQLPRQVPILLAPLVEELLAYWNPQEKAQHPVHLKIPTTLAVEGDPEYVRQIFRNLLSNAFKYTPANQPVFLEATTLPEQTPGEEDLAGTELAAGRNACPQTLICVRDTGPGIPPAEQGMLFQQFVRLKRDLAGSIRGTGLGLYLCRQLVEAMGGRIWVESSGISGEGSSFCFTLPVIAVSSNGSRA